jgi:hypothetical protein
MRRLLGGLMVLGLLGTVAGCYKGRGICDCLDYRDPCCYGPYSLYGPPMHPAAPVAPAPVPPASKAEPLKVLPKEVEPEKPKDREPATEAAAPNLEPPALRIEQ